MSRFGCSTRPPIRRWRRGAGDLAARSWVRAERERARWRLHLVKRRTALKNRVHSILIAFGSPKLGSDLFGVAGRAQLEALDFPERWHANSSLIDLDRG